MRKPGEPRPTAHTVLNTVLRILDQDGDWGGQTLDHIAWALEQAGYSRTTKNGMFRAVLSVEKEGRDQYAAGWEAGRRAAMREYMEMAR